ncbi:hypothetical protein OSSY52_00640 [Tepiditoga spiralis]|uniref:Uncharacterized protein n=1 Tax=Tepiditoga spiralis TaxID=2108365 RepID=A0A7G1G562_9BACT|nr:hypothetical protein OSSY52_00640 [Tepiditoga spiralis]
MYNIIEFKFYYKKLKKGGVFMKKYKEKRCTSYSEGFDRIVELKDYFNYIIKF